MIPRSCKRLAEVDFPIAVVSKHSAREKSIRHGHPSTLHLWWARRPLAACRAMLLALLLPDPCDEHCPDEFKITARTLLPNVQGEVGPSDHDLRKALLKFIGDFANWDFAANKTYIDVGRGLIKAAHGDEPPLVVDPFAGGGSIPLEALRLGCEAFASDLNPVACLILKVMLEDIPRHGPKLADELRRVGAEIKKEAEKELAELYPKDPDGATPIAYLWARTVECESPNCGAEIPLVRSFWLCKKSHRKHALRYQVVRPTRAAPRVEFEVVEQEPAADAPAGTVMGAKAICVACGGVLAPERVRAQLSAQRGGADVVLDANGRRIGGAQIVTVVTLRPAEQGRHYRSATAADYDAVRKAHERVKAALASWNRDGKQDLCPVPDETINPTRPSPNARGLSAVTRYGMTTFGDLYTMRQRLVLSLLCSKARAVHDRDLGDLVGLAVGKIADYGSAQVTWAPAGEFARGSFPRQALSMTWDFAEVVPWADAAGNLDGAIDWIARVAEGWPGSSPGHAELADATRHPLPTEAATVWLTDPPYYDAIPYADLADYFFVWLKRALPLHPGLVDPQTPQNPLTPKAAEIVWNRAHEHEGRPKDSSFFERAMAHAFSEGRRVLREDGIGGVVFAHQSTEGWEALIGGLIGGRWTVTASWPIATERASRTRARESASLATSVHLICRPRPEGAPVGDWAAVLRELPKRVGDWMERLQGEGVRGADLVFACIGPALEIFSRYSKVETADGREVPLAEYLGKVWEVVGRTALGQVLGTAEAKARNGAAGAVEEDARLTALFLWTLQSTEADSADGDAEEADDGVSDDDDEGEDDDSSGKKPKGYTLVFDVVRRFAQPLGINLPTWEGRVIEIKKGVVRLLPVAERAKQLFGDDGAQVVADRLERAPAAQALQGTLFPDAQEGGAVKPRGRGRGRKAASTPPADEKLGARPEATTLDRVHVAMLLQRAGRANALRALIKAEQERGPDFVRLANALSALYPKDSEEKRLLDAMLLAVRN